MACKCRKTAASPHTVVPGDTCIFCAEKHLGAAEAAIALSSSLQDGTRQLTVGELVCAYHHLAAGYPEEGRQVDSLVERILSRLPFTIEDIRKIRERVSELAEEAGEEDVLPGKLDGSFRITGESPTDGERLFCFSWRLAEECGYWKANKGVILGCLSLAQPKFQKICPEAEALCREIRHAVQLRSARQKDTRWLECATLLENAITPAMTDRG